MKKIELKAGDRFGNLTVVKEAPRAYLPSGQSNRIFLMKCDCGVEKEIRLLHFIRGRIKTCGCSQPQHGEVGTKLHNTWRAMKNRVKENYFQSQYYADKGITICDEFKKYIPFREFALKNGWKDGLTIDRIDGNKGYYPENVRFVTQRENNLNQERYKS